jgi:hypothetical protein
MSGSTAWSTLADLARADHRPPDVRPHAQISSQGIQGAPRPHGKAARLRTADERRFPS